MPRIAHETCLITGGAGFIGSHLAELLAGRGHRVLVLDDLSTGRRENLGHLLGEPNVELTEASVNDPREVDRLAAGADVIFHLAAAVGVRLIVDRPVKTMETNILGTDAVLRAALRHRCRVVLASSSEAYGKSARVPFRETDDVLLGSAEKSRWGYAVSKLADEFLATAYARERDLEVVTARLFNTAGPRQSPDYGMVIPSFVGRALRGQPIRVFGTGEQTRCFCHVSDTARALAGLAGHAAASGKVFNVGHGEEVAIADLAARVKEKTRSRSAIVRVPYDEAYAPGFEDLHRRVPDTTRIREAIGWEPERSLDEILADVIEYWGAV